MIEKDKKTKLGKAPEEGKPAVIDNQEIDITIVEQLEKDEKEPEYYTGEDKAS